MKLWKRLTSCLLSLALTLSLFAGVPLPALAADGGNLALGKPVAVSGSEVDDGRWPPELMVDGDTSPNSRWSSNTSADAWCYVDLGAVYDVGKVVLNWQLKAMRYEILVSYDAENWRTAYEGVNTGSNIEQTDTAEFEPVSARYVKMQGIERTPYGANTQGTGYSLYEFEVYADPETAALTDQQIADQTAASLAAPTSAYRDFTLQTEGRLRETRVAWGSSHPEIIAVQDGNARIALPEQNTTVTLTAEATTGEAAATRTFDVLVLAREQVPLAYRLYPVPQSLSFKEKNVPLEDAFTVVGDAALDAATQAKWRDILEAYGIGAQTADQPEAGQAALLLGVYGENSAAEAYFEALGYDPAALMEKTDAYVLDVDLTDEGLRIVVLGKSSDAVFFGLATLDELLAEDAQRISLLRIEDWSSTLFRGFIEGFYGIPWSHEDRQSLMEFGARFKMNAYIYGPKDDPYHRDKWREMYPEDELKQLGELVETSKKTKVEFIWAIHPGLSIDLSSEADYQAVVAKLNQLYSVGVRQFGFFMDDIDLNKGYEDREKIVALLNRLETEFVQAKGDVKPIVFVPTYYNKDWGIQEQGVAYLEAMRGLDPNIQLMWTGDSVTSNITRSVIDWVTGIVQRDVFVWWNFPVNDYCPGNLLMGRSMELGNDVQGLSGLVSNPMNQAEASKVSLFSVADYTWNMAAYDADASWEASFAYIEPALADALRIFSENVSVGYGLHNEESLYIADLFTAFREAAASNGDLDAAGAPLLAAFAEIREACADLLAGDVNPNLTEEIAGWANALDRLAKAGELALHATLDAAADRLSGEEIWQAYTDACTALEESSAFPTYAGSETMASAGSSRLRPFIEELLADTQGILQGALFANRFGGDTNALYTNAPALMGSAVQADGGRVSLENLGAVQLLPGQYIGIRLEALKVLREYAAAGIPESIAVETSENGIDWTPLAKQPEGTALKYLRAANNGERPVQFTLDRLSLFAVDNPAGIRVTLGDGMAYYQDYTADKAIDGDPDTYMWLAQHQRAGQTITFDLGRAIPLYEMVITMQQYDTMGKASVEISADGLAWTEIGVIENGGWPDFLTALDAGGARTRYARIRLTMDTGSWLRINEVTFNGVNNVSRASKVGEVSLTLGEDMEFYEDYTADKALDGDLSTWAWLAQHQRIGQTVTFAFDAPRTLFGATFTQSSVGDCIARADVETSLDGESWNRIGEIVGGGAATGYVTHFTLDGSPVQYVRIRITQDLDAWVKLFEAAFYDSLGGAQSLYLESTAGGAVAGAQDGSLTSAYTPSIGETGRITLKNPDNRAADTLVILQNENSLSGAAVEAVTADGVQTLGTLDRAYNRFDLSGLGEVYEACISWENGNAPSIYEAAFLSSRTPLAAPVISGVENGASTRGSGVRLLADQTVTWTVNGVALDRKGSNLLLSTEGGYIVTATAANGAVSEPVGFVIDRTGPVLSSEQTAANGMTNQNAVVRASEPALFELDGVALDGLRSSITVTEPGRHVVRAYDKAGNRSDAFVFTVEKSAPILSTNFYILNGVTRYNVAVTADRRVDYYVNGELAAENEYRCKFLDPGVYEVKAIDAAGNESKTLKFEIRR